MSHYASLTLRRKRIRRRRIVCTLSHYLRRVASKAFSLYPTANVANLIMLSKVKNIAVIEAEGLLKEPNRRKHWFHPFNADK